MLLLHPFTCSHSLSIGCLKNIHSRCQSRFQQKRESPLTSGLMLFPKAFFEHKPKQIFSGWTTTIKLTTKLKAHRFQEHFDPKIVELIRKFQNLYKLWSKKLVKIMLSREDIFTDFFSPLWVKSLVGFSVLAQFAGSFLLLFIVFYVWSSSQVSLACCILIGTV